MNEKNLLNELRQIESGLSPENLHCDGEASPAYVKRRYRELMAQRAAVIKKLSRTPSDKEIWGF